MYAGRQRREKNDLMVIFTSLYFITVRCTRRVGRTVRRKTIIKDGQGQHPSRQDSLGPDKTTRHSIPAPIQQAPTRNLLAYKFARFWALPFEVQLILWIRVYGAGVTWENYRSNLAETSVKVPRYIAESVRIHRSKCESRSFNAAASVKL